MRINLIDEKLYLENEIIFDKKISFVFGKNGTGKSIMTSLIKSQVADKDVRVFQGFHSVISDNGKLNSIVLGEINVEIENKIELLLKEIEQQENVVKQIREDITETDSKNANLWKKHDEASKKSKKKNKEITDSLREIASEIKRSTNPQLSDPNYNISSLKLELKKAALLQDNEVDKLKLVLKSEIKNAKRESFFDIDLVKYLNATNEILASEVKERNVISRIEGDNEKRIFAEQGLKIHKEGDLCSFCGNVIEDEVIEELERYFSADEVKELQSRISNAIETIENEKSKLNVIKIKEGMFYPNFKTEVESLNNKINTLKNEYIDFLEILKVAIYNKNANLFSTSPILDLEIPVSYQSLENEYIDLIRENNENNLADQQRISRDKLRYHYIKKALDDSKYEIAVSQLDFLTSAEEKLSDEINIKRQSIEGENGLLSQIQAFERSIKDLKLETQNEEKLAFSINDKLRNSVSFELEHYKGEEGNGYYAVRCLRTNELKDVSRLSTGEKNIIAFLYFIEKLSELTEDGDRDRVIVFDDPMSSNDDGMQYLIIEELQRLFNKITDREKLIIMTHNSHFYLNVKYRRSYRKDKFLRLVSEGKYTQIKFIANENDDFKTNYEALWTELIFLYENASSSSGMLLNPIRRIIETFTKFNELNIYDFYSSQVGAKKYFDVNSHSIDDLEAELNGKEKLEVIQIMKGCFVDNGHEGHFNKFWSIVDNDSIN